jgi:hypothetical protein
MLEQITNETFIWYGGLEIECEEIKTDFPRKDQLYLTIAGYQ